MGHEMQWRIGTKWLLREILFGNMKPLAKIKCFFPGIYRSFALQVHGRYSKAVVLQLSLRLEEYPWEDWHNHRHFYKYCIIILWLPQVLVAILECAVKTKGLRGTIAKSEFHTAQSHLVLRCFWLRGSCGHSFFFKPPLSIMKVMCSSLRWK